MILDHLDYSIIMVETRDFPAVSAFLQERGFIDLSEDTANVDIKDALSGYLYVEASKNSFDNLKSAKNKFPGTRFTPIGAVPGVQLSRMSKKVGKKAKESIILGKFYKVKSGQWKNLVGMAETYDGKSVILKVRIVDSFKYIPVDVSSIALAPPERQSIERLYFNMDGSTNAIYNYRKAIIIDGHNALFRNVFGYPNYYNKATGAYIGGFFGFFFTLLKIRQLYPEYKIYCVFDRVDQSKFELMPEYKAGRQKYTPKFWEEMNLNLEMITTFLTYCGIPVIRCEGKEGDDVIASLASYLLSQGHSDIGIYSKDEDFYQLVSDKVFCLKPKPNFRGHVTMVRPVNVEAQYGVPPDKFVQYRILAGDSSDAIPCINKFLTKVLNKKDFQRYARETSDMESLRDLVVSEHPESTYFFDTVHENEYTKAGLNKKMLTMKQDLFTNNELPLDSIVKFPPYQQEAAKKILVDCAMFRELESWGRSWSYITGQKSE